jgi:hypothetical protein
MDKDDGDEREHQPSAIGCTRHRSRSTHPALLFLWQARRATLDCHEVRTYSHPAGTLRCNLWQRESDLEIAFRRRDPKLRLDLIFHPGDKLLGSANPLSIVRG